MAITKQITNFDFTSASSGVTPSGVTWRKVDDDNYIELQFSESALPISPFKIGYSCEPKGIETPIKITIQSGDSSITNEFYLGKTGIFEFQPETYMDINSEDPTEQTATVTIISIFVPEDLVFILDYSY